MQMDAQVVIIVITAAPKQLLGDGRFAGRLAVPGGRAQREVLPILDQEAPLQGSFSGVPHQVPDLRVISGEGAVRV